ncbi:hypothetical protein I3760_01G178200 [Carya illinoinensis]|nr:hypothetical protein I3760_01G178200 [Carya illinoinensis]
MDFIRRSLRPKWSSGLCDCGVNKTTSCSGQAGCVYALLMTVQFHWILSCLNRKKLQSKYGLPDEPCCDCCVHYSCEQCALCQEYAELNTEAAWTPPNVIYI